MPSGGHIRLAWSNLEGAVSSPLDIGVDLLKGTGGKKSLGNNSACDL